MSRWLCKQDEIVGPYRLVSGLGEPGGNGEVWRSQRIDGNDGQVALKILRSASPEKVARFRNEIRALEQLSGIAGVLPILEYCVPNQPSSHNRAWLAMPIADSLQDQLLEKEFTIHRVVAAVAGLARTLSVVHERGYSHRDIKPSNLFWYDGRSAIGDFGLVWNPDDEHITIPGTLLGPRFFMAPEILMGVMNVDGHQSADVFSLAKVLWVLCTNQRYPLPGPFSPADKSTLLSTWIRSATSQLSELDRVLESTTFNDPSQRLTMHELSEDLLAWLVQPAPEIELDNIDQLARQLAAIASPSLESANSDQLNSTNASETFKKIDDGILQIKKLLDATALPNECITMRDPYSSRFGGGITVYFNGPDPRSFDDMLRRWIDEPAPPLKKHALGVNVWKSSPTSDEPRLYIVCHATVHSTGMLHLKAAQLLIGENDSAMFKPIWETSHVVRLGSLMEDSIISEVMSGLAKTVDLGLAALLDVP